MEVDYRRDRMIDDMSDFVATSTLSHCTDEMFMTGWKKACEAIQPDLDALAEALAAAEAECAAARTALSPPPLQMAGPTDSIVLQPSPARRWADLRQAADANDATRARLGLGRIGEAR